MPLYEYECPRTGRRFEVIQKFSDEPIRRCEECDEHPECAGEARRLLSVPAIQFKGEGWYVTDYGKGGKKPEKEKTGDSGDKKDSKEKSKKDESKKGDSKKSSDKKAS